MCPVKLELNYTVLLTLEILESDEAHRKRAIPSHLGD